ncbi:MAG TPA: 4-vinyl reductase [Longimicrobiales bacterium]|nr:4-vinyl reductase [Longimicrobiales bacterium]
MTPSTTRPSELTLPAASIAALRHALATSVGEAAAADALRAAGHAAGDSLFRILAGDGDAAGMPASQFWSGVSRLFSSRGWGQLSFSQVHPGVGALDAGDWAEAATATADQPSCHFTTGMLANLIGRTANAEIAVLEVECRSRGDARCRFLFGGPDALDGVYQSVAAGAATEAALTRLG